MIEFKNLPKEKPYRLLKKYYDKALLSEQLFIEGACISSYDPILNEVDSRYVNLKYIHNDKFIFFSNYESPKAKQFEKSNQISVVIFWSNINIQIRIKAKIKKLSIDLSRAHFKKRSPYKNALSIFSKQSSKINSYEELIQGYNSVLKHQILTECPDYWGGYSFTPYYFEFWEGNENRINKRISFEKSNKKWFSNILQP